MNTNSGHATQRTLPGTLVGILLVLVSTSALAGFAEDDIVGIGGFLSAYSGVTSGANPNPGDDPEGSFFEVNTDEQSFAGIGISSAASNYSMSTHINSGSGSAGMGFVDFTAATQSMYDFTSFHSNAWVHGGWADKITITAPGFTGQTAIWLFQVNVDAEFAASGFVGAPRIEIRPFLDHEWLDDDVPGFDDSDSDPVGTSAQHAEWKLTLGFIGASQTRTVDSTVTFAAEIVIGQQFDLGVFALGIAGARNSSAFQTILSTANVHTGTVTWGGSTGLSVGGVPVANFTVASASGIDWTPAVPADDFDVDGVVNSGDNCLFKANPDQQDTDGDAIGNACDPDIAPQPNDCLVDFTDLGALKAAFFSTPASTNWNADADFDGSGLVDFSDLGTMKMLFFSKPGPSGVANACP